MRVRDRVAACALLLSAAAAGCFYPSAPKGWLTPTENAPRDAFGGWIRVEDRSGGIVEGELLAAAADTLHLLTQSLGWVSVPVSQIRRATLTGYGVSLTPIITYGIVGTLSTVSHGFFLILTAPIWIISSTVSASNTSRKPRIRSASPDALRIYARFPQGLPPGLDRSTIRGKQ